jgi:hypothetical protein
LINCHVTGDDAVIELQTAVGALMGLIYAGGGDAARDLFRGRVVNGDEDLSETWYDLFGAEPQAYPLVERLAHDPYDPLLRAEVRALLEWALLERPHLLPAGRFGVMPGDVQAAAGAVAAAVIQGSPITIANMR